MVLMVFLMLVFECLCVFVLKFMGWRISQTSPHHHRMQCHGLQEMSGFGYGFGTPWCFCLAWRLCRGFKSLLVLDKARGFYYLQQNYLDLSFISPASWCILLVAREVARARGKSFSVEGWEVARGVALINWVGPPRSTLAPLDMCTYRVGHHQIEWYLLYVLREKPIQNKNQKSLNFKAKSH